MLLKLADENPNRSGNALAVQNGWGANLGLVGNAVLHGRSATRKAAEYFLKASG